MQCFRTFRGIYPLLEWRRDEAVTRRREGIASADPEGSIHFLSGGGKKLSGEGGKAVLLLIPRFLSTS